MKRSEIVEVHFINNAGEDFYIEVYDLNTARKLAEELRLLKIPAEIQYTTIPEAGVLKLER